MHTHCLLPSHEGEFWPFSIYPMFSQAGNPWTRAMVLDVTTTPDAELWEKQSLANGKSDVYLCSITALIRSISQIL